MPEGAPQSKQPIDRVRVNITEAINAARSRFGAAGLGGVELELRIGKYQERGFVPGVSAGVFELIRRRLSSGDAFAPQPELVELVYIPDSQGMRYVCDPTSGLLTRVNQKERIQWFPDDQTRMEYDEFDVRFSLAVDRDLPPEELQRCQERCGGPGARFDVRPFLKYGTAPFEKRLKRRVSFADRTGILKVDLTRVESQPSTSSGPASTSYEVEIELTPYALENPGKINTAVIYQLIFLLRVATNVARDPHWFEDVPRVLCPENDPTGRYHIDTVRGIVYNTFGPDKRSRGRPRFPGSMPVNFRARHINEKIKRDKYFVSEKTDGERYFLCIKKGGSAYLLNRAMKVFLLNDERLGRYLSRVFAQGGDTLLDIELVRHINTLRPVFMVFDAMLSNGRNFKDYNLEERLKEIGRLIKAHRMAPEYRAIPVDVLGKAFLPVKNISVFRELITHIDGVDQHGSEPRRVYNDHTKRCHFSDGLIFAPDARYVDGTDMNLIKWKYPAYCTIDFKFKNPNYFSRGAGDGRRREEEEVDLYAFFKTDKQTTGVPEGTTVDVQFGKGIVDKTLLVGRDKREYEIGEFYYDKARSGWYLCGLRSDEKDTPNYITVAVDVLAALAENVTFDELERRILSDGPGSV